jgi:hypothetical protein
VPISKRRKKDGKTVRPRHRRSAPTRGETVPLMDLFATLGELDEIEANLIKDAAAEYEAKFTPACFDCRKYDCDGSCTTITEKEHA